MTQQWENWARTEQVTPRQVHTPRTTEEISAIVAQATADDLRVRAVGSGHSFTGVAVAPDVQIRPDAMDGLVELDRETGLVTVQAGIPLHRLNPLLAEHGLAMEVLGDIDRQTIAGAISTGTHGSGERFGSISTQVRALELVTADGSVITCSATKNPELFAAARVSLGALGIIATVTLQCVPLYALHAIDEPRPVEDVLDEIDALVAANDHYEFFWFPHTETALTRRYDRLPGDVELRPWSRMSRFLDDRLVTNIGFEALLRVGTRRPSLIPGITRFVTKAVGSRDIIDLAPNVYASARNVRFRESEYAVPRAHLVDALRELKSWLDKHGEPVSFPFEVRFSKADDIWLSPAHERDVAYVAFHQYHRLPHQRWFGICEQVLGEAGGRPHWGKLHSLGAEDLRQRYPRFDDFVRLRDTMDPNGRFGNDHLDRILGTAPTVN